MIEISARDFDTSRASSPCFESATAVMDVLRTGATQSALEMAATARAIADGAELCAAHGAALLAANQFEHALLAFRKAIAFGDASPVTALNVALATRGAGEPLAAEALIRDLAARHPGWDEPPLRLAESLRDRGRSREAEAAYQDAIAANPFRVDALLGLAGLQLTRGAILAARDLARRSCSIEPRRAEAWEALGFSFLLTRDAALAEAAFARAQVLAPHHLKIALHRIEAAYRAGTAQAELERLKRCSLDDPLNVTLLAARAQLLVRLGRLQDGVELQDAVCTLEPDCAEMAKLLAYMLHKTNHNGRTEEALRRASELAPEDLELRRSYPPILMRLQRHREARDILEALILEQGETAADLGNLSVALTCLGLQEDGIATVRRLIALDPAEHAGWKALCAVLPYHHSATGAELLSAFRAYDNSAQVKPDDAFVSASTQCIDRRRRIRIGLLSMDLRCHPVGWLTVAGFENLDPAEFEIVCFAQAESDDLLQRRFRAVASEWHVMDPTDRDDIVRRVREAAIDIIIDLGGYGERGMMAACARRLAPVQIKWVGSQSHSSGLKEMDWFMTDRWETPPELEQHYSEKLLRLPDGYVCYSPPTYAPDVGPLPSLLSGFVTFGCFNNMAKVTPIVLSAWSRILKRIPKARLVFKSHVLSDKNTCDEILARLVACGIDTDRVELRGRSGHRTLLGEYGDVDIALDPFPYTGGLTTCEALWMGVPTVTMPGETFSSRHSTSHMNNVGLGGWVARDLVDYESIAVAHAGNIGALSALRSELRDRVKNSPLCDAPRFGRGLATALRAAWSEWSEGGVSTPLEVSA